MADKKQKGRLWPPLAPGPYPWLVYSHGKDYECQTFCTITNLNDTRSMKIPELQHLEFWASCDGWGVFSDAGQRQFFVWNPVTREQKELPSLNFKGTIQQCIFHSPPSDPNQFIILLATDLPLIRFLRLGDKQWTELNYEDELDKCLKESGDQLQQFDDDALEVSRHLYYISSCNGNLFAKTRASSSVLMIEKLEPDGIAIRSLSLRPPWTPQCVMKLKHVPVDFQGEIYCIMFGFRLVKYFNEDEEEFIAINVHRLDQSEMIWERVDDAPDLAFFADYSFDCSFCCQATEPDIHGNRVYFPSGKKLYCYNIRDGTLSTSRPLTNISLSSYISYWIMPDQGSTTYKEEEAKFKRIMIAGEGYEKVGVKVKESDVIVEKGDKEEESKICCLPSDLAAAQIVGRLDLVDDYLHLRATCTMFQKISPLTDWKKTCNGSLSPWLIFFEKDSVCSLVDPRHGDKYFINLPPSLLLPGCEMCYSKNGWLLMSGDTASSFLFNPFAKKIVPAAVEDYYPHGLYTYHMGFSSYPASSDCLIVEIVKSTVTVRLRFARLGGEGWTEAFFDDGTDFYFGDNSPVFYDGAFYWLGLDGSLGVLEFGDDHQIIWNVLPKPRKPCNSYQQNFLVECNGDLLSVFVGKFQNEVRVLVFRLNLSSRTWIKVQSLGAYMIFISHNSSFATVATIAGMENKIYFPRFCGQSGHNIVFYSLDTKKFHSFESEDSEIDFLHGTREQLRACWIEPKWC